MFLCVSVGLSDKDDWLELNDRGLDLVPPGLKPALRPAEGKAPAPVVGPHLDPAESLQDLLEPRGPNIPVLPKPPTKVGLFLFQKLEPRH